ncbi:50S ribosomal protein L5 [Buchnera aphidicola (Thelaxes californica)]|uniref:Large ribosomal subunit protein uL5 n=1 Tax=Buchnera aphidicola (Thelaxes californica) TaxID=1315998 RepID=A0A4D6YA76_9GAMM|nr:50S ribosomal protein L5 [Buchnera aphidicola]QCI26916.1 50S ribosomal protein L5 [Buchnera aphidicola (Thelaxes californica)]
MENMYEYYKKNIVLQLKKIFKYTSIMQVPKISKITLNIGVGNASVVKKVLDHALMDLKLISGQKPIITKSRKSIAAFKIRKGYPLGCKVTLRGSRKWDFFEKLISIAIPRVRDFRGFSRKSFDGRGNYNLGIKEQIIFPEINYDKIDIIRGMNITITTTAQSDEEAYILLKMFNFPFKKKL